ncbi:MAG TPA: type I-U CRISPR-associated protein Csx17 [Gaiellaceae bacterium]|nr:type I-U CRISPR-associated protein Csx17 [Gaiellaceae bacterium]
MPDLALRGCRTTPLLSYLKALGVFRHVAKDDPTARLWWDREGFAWLRSRLDAAGLVDFFVERYVPSPITSPWNGSSGYYPGDNMSAIDEVEGTDHARLAPLRETIASARALLGKAPRKPDEKEKHVLLESWRASCPESALEWLDACTVLAEAGPSMNPLLGTGGNDGHLEFSNNFLARLIDCLPQLFGRGFTEISSRRLRSAVFGETVELTTAAIGMFDPGGAGLPNSSSGPAENAIVNPWDFVLLLEGTLFFGGGVARRLSVDYTSFPFTVRDTARLGRSLETSADTKTRGETWLPDWRRPASLPSLDRLFAEGRTQDGRHQARSGREMLRAAADVGVDRGIASFERIVYAERFGRSYVAVPAGHVGVRPVRSVELLRLADRWLTRARRVDSAQVRHRVGELDRAAADVASASDEQSALERWLLALARTQLAVSRRPASRATSEPTHVPPLGGLDARLVRALEDSVEHRLARALAAVGRGVGGTSLRSLVEPVERTGKRRYAWSGTRSRTQLSLRQPEALLVAFASLQAVRDLEGRATLDDAPPKQRARLTDVAAFLAGETDDERLIRLAFAFSLCGPCDQRSTHASRRPEGIDRLYAACRLVTSEADARPPEDPERTPGRAPEVIPMLAGGNGGLAARTAARRLRADRLAPNRGLETIKRTPDDARRIAAALAFPLHPDDRKLLELAVLTPEPANEDPSPEGAIA